MAPSASRATRRQGNIISGLTTVNFNDNSSDNTLLIGDNSEPVQEPNGANGFTINVSNAVGYNPSADAHQRRRRRHRGPGLHRQGHDQCQRRYRRRLPGAQRQLCQVPALETRIQRANDGDNYNPNWTGFEQDAFAICAGASAGTERRRIGFQNWVISSTGAKSVGSMNILAFGDEGSTTAQTITLTDDGSPTMLFAPRSATACRRIGRI